MTALNPATDIPSQINTLEKLAVWVGMAMANINPSLTVIEGVGYTERACQSNIFYVAADDAHRALIRQSIKMDAAYQAGGLKMWMFAQELSTNPIPSIFKSN